MSQREIKFRVWDGKEMLYKHLVARPQFADTLSVLQDEEFAIKTYCVKEWKIMQFTGLKDRNGTDIYEGDLVYVAGTGIAEMVYPFFTLFDAESEGDIGEIKGNVHEHP